MEKEVNTKEKNPSVQSASEQKSGGQTAEKAITREKIDQLYHTMQKNASLVNEWKGRLMESCEDENWAEIVSKRSQILRQVFEENETVSKAFWDALPPRLYGEEIDILFELVYHIHTEYLYVVSFGLRLARLLLPYFEDRQDYGKIVFLNYSMGYSNYLLFDRTLNMEGPSDWLQYFEKITSYEAHYAEIENEGFRGIFFSAYLNLMKYSVDYPSLHGRTHEYYEKAHALWESEAVQAKDAGSAVMKSKIADIDAQYLYLQTATPSLIAAPDDYCKMAEQSLKKIGRVNIKSDPTGYYKLMECNVKRLRRQTSDEACVAALSDYIIKAIPPLNFEKKEDNRTFQLLMNEFTTYAYALKIMQSLPEEKQDLLDHALLRILQDAVHVPYSFHPDDLNWIFYSFYQTSAPRIRKEETKLSALRSMILCRQPMTYIHSLMVTSISKMICESVIANKPELFVGLSGCASPQEVREHRDQILSMVEKCGLLYDIGKCRVAIVINTQDRKLTENEFGILKHHPQLGVKLIEKDASFQPYLDVIMGHHKTYDGNGYPEFFDNTLSSVRILIDLIAIADSTDAATDILGRNYTEGKNFKQLLKELKEGAGKRYNPELVAVIEKDQKLQEEIARITSEGRLSLYQGACREIAEMHKSMHITSL